MKAAAPSLFALRRILAFRDVSEVELERLAKQMLIRNFPRKAVIIRQGEPSSHIYFLVSGYVKVCRGGALSQLNANDRRGRDRQEIALAILGEGHMLGEMAALTEAPRSASVVALSDCSLIQFEREAFLDSVRRNPEVSFFIMRYLVTRLRDANRHIDLMKTAIDVRVKGLLRNLKEIGLPADLYPSNAEIGRMVGASREAVSQVVQQIESARTGHKSLPESSETLSWDAAHSGEAAQR